MGSENFGARNRRTTRSNVRNHLNVPTRSNTFESSNPYECSNTFERSIMRATTPLATQRLDRALSTATTVCDVNHLYCPKLCSAVRHQCCCYCGGVENFAQVCRKRLVRRDPVQELEEQLLVITDSQQDSLHALGDSTAAFPRNLTATVDLNGHNVRFNSIPAPPAISSANAIYHRIRLSRRQPALFSCTIALNWHLWDSD